MLFKENAIFWHQIKNHYQELLYIISWLFVMLQVSKSWKIIENVCLVENSIWWWKLLIFLSQKILNTYWKINLFWNILFFILQTKYTQKFLRNVWENISQNLKWLRVTIDENHNHMDSGYIIDVRISKIDGNQSLNNVFLSHNSQFLWRNKKTTTLI